MNKVSTPELLFYQKLVELFYAIAATDKIILKAEYELLTQLVDEVWKSLDHYENQFNPDAPHQISIVFKWFDYERMDAEDCFESFERYQDGHKDLFSEKRKALILNTVQKIKEAFSGTNKSTAMVNNLQLLFKNK